MKGVILKFDLASPEPRFWDVFGAIRSELDRFHWCFSSDPFMAPPAGFAEDVDATLSVGAHNTSTVLWCRGALDKYADSFNEEFVELWAIDGQPTDAVALVREFFIDSSAPEAFIASRAAFWLRYVDGTFWECFANSAWEWTLAFLMDSAEASDSMTAHPTNSSRRAQAFIEAGLDPGLA